MTKRDRMMILGVLAVVLLGGFWFFVLSPQRKAATKAQAALSGAQTELAAAQQKLSAGQKAQADFRRDRTTILKLGRVVPETDDIPTLLTQLQAIADKNHVGFQDYSVSPNAGASSTSTGAVTSTTPTESTSTSASSTNATAPLFPPGSVSIDGGLGRTPIQLTLKGTYANLENYLQAVERFAVLSQEQSSTKGRLMVVDAFGYVVAPNTTSNDSGTGKPTAEPRHPKLLATLNASIYFAPPLSAPSASAAAATPGVTTPAGSTSTSTGTAAIGSLR